MNKILIVQPFMESKEKTRQLEAEAEQYVRKLGYEPVSSTLDDFTDITYHDRPLRDILVKESFYGEFNANVFLIGITVMVASMAGTICFWDGWQDVPYCQDIYNLAFRYGLQIILKPPEE